MAAVRKFRISAQNGRQSQRHRILLELSAKVDGQQRTLHIHDISATGFLARSNPPLAVGQTVSFVLSDGSPAKAVVVRSEGTFAGCTFCGPISLANISAARLRSQVNLPEPTPPLTADLSGQDDWFIEPLSRHWQILAMLAGALLGWGGVIALAMALLR